MLQHPSSSTPIPGTSVLLYDGECGLCNKAVRFLLRIDRKAHLRFAPLQGPTAQAYLKAKGLPTEDFDSMVFVPDWDKRETESPQFRTTGVLSALAKAGGLGTAFQLLRVVPAPLRDAGYRLIARWRYNLFGTYRPRPLARPEWTARFLP